MLLRWREKVSQFQESIYMVFILSMVALVSAGLNSGDVLYKVIFVIAALFLLLKLAITDFTVREIIWMAVIALLVGVDFLRNGEKTLIMTIMGIFGAKNVSLKKVFSYALWVKVVFTAGTLLLAATGIIENEIMTLPKNGEYLKLYCYGYYHPNVAFANIFLTLLIAIVVYQDKLKWYAYVGFTLLILLAYRIFICRTGVVIWGVLLIMIVGYRIAKKLNREKQYFVLFMVEPILLAVLTFALPWIGMRNTTLLSKMDFYLTGRLNHMIRFIEELKFPVLGHIPSEPFDSLYFHLLYNYGIVVFLISLLAYILTIWYCIKSNKYYEIIVMGVMAVYGFMEFYPLSVAWNLSLLCFSWVLFKGRNIKNECVQ